MSRTDTRYRFELISPSTFANFISTVHCPLCNVHGPRSNVHCLLSTVQCPVSCPVSTVVQYPLSSVQCPVARGLKMKSLRIHLSSSNFSCVTQTMSLRPPEIKLDEFFLRHRLKLFRWTFFQPIVSPFMWIALEKKSRIVSGFWNFSCVTQN